MPCYTPLRGFLAKFVNPETGKRSVVFNPKDAFTDLPVFVACGRCIGCRLERSRQWAIRCVHEASMYEKNCFITLTYDDAHLPVNGSLVKRDFQLFMKRLRKRFGKGVRYYECGEYGENFSRPHYHACLFNFDFPDKVFWSCRNHVNLFVSAILKELWPFGYSTIGDVTFDSAAYVARYILKKYLGRNSDEYYKGRVPEYTTMSRRPGIGRLWFEKFKSDVFPHDFVVIRGGRKCKPPRYYDTIYDLTNHKSLVKIKSMNMVAAKHSPDNTPARLEVREEVKCQELSNLRRRYEVKSV